MKHVPDIGVVVRLEKLIHDPPTFGVSRQRTCTGVQVRFELGRNPTPRFELEAQLSIPQLLDPIGRVGPFPERNDDAPQAR